MESTQTQSHGMPLVPEDAEYLRITARQIREAGGNSMDIGAAVDGDEDYLDQLAERIDWAVSRDHAFEALVGALERVQEIATEAEQRVLAGGRVNPADCKLIANITDHALTLARETAQ